MTVLLEPFLAALAPEVRARAESRLLAPVLATTWASGRAAWPGVPLEESRFAAHLAEKVGEHADRDPEAVLAALDGKGLYLAAAVLAGDPAAARAVAELLPAIDPALRQLGADATRIAEVRQQVLTAVVVGGERGPAIAGYGGRSELRSWLRSVAVRTALKSFARERPVDELDEEDLAGLADDPRLAAWKTAYADVVVAALRDALAGLAPRGRTLLRLHHLDGVGLDDLARMYGVHRATVARWLAAAREAVFEDTRVRVEGRLGLGEDSAASVVRLVQSQLAVSLYRLLESGPRD